MTAQTETCMYCGDEPKTGVACDVCRAYQPGQEVNGTPSREYVAVAREVQAWITGTASEEGT